MINYPAPPGANAPTGLLPGDQVQNVPVNTDTWALSKNGETNIYTILVPASVFHNKIAPVPSSTGHGSSDTSLSMDVKIEITKPSTAQGNTYQDVVGGDVMQTKPITSSSPNGAVVFLDAGVGIMELGMQNAANPIDAFSGLNAVANQQPPVYLEKLAGAQYTAYGVFDTSAGGVWPSS